MMGGAEKLAYVFDSYKLFQKSVSVGNYLF